MTFAIAAFLFSLAGILGVFGLKQHEEHTGRKFAPELREKLDVRALRFKELLIALEKDAEKLPPEALHFGRLSVHKLALGAAYLARALERNAHRLADLVSYKGRFTRRAPRSEFLKKVAEHKNGNGASEAGTDSSEFDRSVS